MKYFPLILLTVFFFSCSVNKDYDSKIGVVITHYANGKMRTKYIFRENRISSGFFLFDSNGVVRISQKDTVDLRCSNYRNKSMCDFSDEKRKKFALEMNPLIEGIHKYLRYENINYKKGSGMFYFWLSPDGNIDHAVCKEFRGLSKSMVNSILTYMETWMFSPGLTANGSVIARRINFE